MTYLGTRPPLISETNLYELHHRARLAIKPGITGMEQIMEQEGITKELKSRDQMEWVRRANNARSRVDEIILNELVYV